MPPQDPRHLLDRAVVGFGERVAAVAPRDWDRPSPCEGWTVRDLVAHVVEEERFGPPLLAGQTLDEIGDRFAGDLLGDDPLEAWRDAGEIGPAATVPANADRQTALLARFGRDVTTTAPVAPARRKETT